MQLRSLWQGENVDTHHPHTISRKVITDRRAGLLGQDSLGSTSLALQQAAFENHQQKQQALGAQAARQNTTFHVFNLNAMTDDQQ